jgi:hypothetical protein
MPYPHELNDDFAHADVAMQEWFEREDSDGRDFPFRQITPPDRAWDRDDDRVREFADYCDQLLRWERNAAWAVEVAKGEVRRLQDKLAVAEQRRESIRGHLMSVMRIHGQTKVRTPVGTASITRGRERIEIPDPACVERWPAPVVQAAVVPQPPKILKDVLKREFAYVFSELPGVSVECGEDFLVIK